MIKFGKLAIISLAISALVIGLSGCKKAEDAEKAGKEEIQKMGEEAKEKVEKVEEKVEKTKEVIKK
jgi:hypothetical protein